MQPASKLVIQVSGGTVTVGSGTQLGSGATNYMDTLGFDFACVQADVTTTAANTYDSLAIMHCDTTLSASFVTAAGYVGGTDFDIAAGSATRTLDMINVDLKGMKRFIKLVQIPSVDSATSTVWANLFKGDEMPGTPAEAGVTNWVG